MLEKIAASGSDRRRTERLLALTQPHMPSSSRSLCAATNLVHASTLAHASVSREFSARFLLDTHCPLKRHSTRHSDTSRNQRNFFRCIKTASATRHLNRTPATRHSNAKITPFSHSLFFQFVRRTRSAFVFSGFSWQLATSPWTNETSKQREGGTRRFPWLWQTFAAAQIEDFCPEETSSIRQLRYAQQNSTAPRTPSSLFPPRKMDEP
jgi:hypothetical protein